MADFNTALVLTLQHEGGFEHNTVTGEIVNHGVTLWTLRSLGILKSTGAPTPADIAFVQNLSVEEAGDIYRQQYWDKLLLDQFKDQALANKAFDLAVNTGTNEATRFLQNAAGVPVDGQMGPMTLAAVNSGDPAALLLGLQNTAARYYRQVAQVNPNLAPDLPGWLNRLYSA